MSLGGLAQLAAGRGDTAEAIDLYRRSLTAFETIGDRGEEARILSEMGWTQIANGDLRLARRSFLQAIRAHTDIASVRGVGLALLGLAAADAAEERNERAVQLAAAAEVYAQQEGIVVAYSGEIPGTELVERARASLSPDELERAMEAGRRLTIDEAIALARGSA
jgi:tetratricopeptide (TPR) repeat protein